ncbi:MAG: glycosyltransferase family 39 protein, partial [bacterium]
LTFNDSPLYHQLACTLLDHHRFAASASAEPDPLRTPVYPLFVAGIYALFGKVPWVVFVVQILLDCVSCCLLFLTLRRILSGTVAHIAAFFYAIDPFLILYASTFLTEILFVFVLVVALYVYGTILSHGRDRTVLLQHGLLGFALGLATLVRPIALYLPLVLIVLTLVIYRKRRVFAFANSAILIVAFAVIVSPWLLRNHGISGRATLTYIDSWDLLALNVGAMEAAKRHQDLETTSAELLAEADLLMAAEGLHPENMNLMEKADYWRQLAFRYILRDPIGFAIAHAKGTIFIFANLGTSDFAHVLHRPSRGLGIPTNFLAMIREFFTKKSPMEILLGAAVVPLLLITYLALAVGLVVAWRRFNRTFLAFCLLIALYFVTVPGALGVVRFKLPALPFLVGFVGIGIAYVAEKWKAHRALTVDKS